MEAGEWAGKGSILIYSSLFSANAAVVLGDYILFFFNKIGLYNVDVKVALLLHIVQERTC